MRSLAGDGLLSANSEIRRFMVPSTALAFDTLPRRLIALPGVYRPQADTWLLAEALSHEPMGADSDVLDIGTGTGALALPAARTGARVEPSTSRGPRSSRPA